MSARPVGVGAIDVLLQAEVNTARTNHTRGISHDYDSWRDAARRARRESTARVNLLARRLRSSRLRSRTSAQTAVEATAPPTAKGRSLT
jgi:hypothetical protein